MYSTIGVLTGGGDAPGLNAVIRAVVTTATGHYGLKVIGIEDGFEGLLGETQTRLLAPSDVRGLLPRGGTILGTRNRGKFVERNEQGVVIKPKDVYDEAVKNLRCLCIDAQAAKILNRLVVNILWLNNDEAVKNLRCLGIDALVVLGGEGT